MKRKLNKTYILVALLVVAVMGFVYLMVPADPLRAYVNNIDKLERKRFTPSESVDVAMAMKLVTHEPPRMLAPPEPGPPLLLFPPTEEDLARLSGH